MSQNPTIQSDDEIDLFALLQVILEGKWTIAICTAIALAGAGLFLLITKPVYEASLLVYEPSLETMSEFQQINRFSNIGKPIISEESIIGYEDAIIAEITTEMLERVFTGEFYDYNEVRDAIKQHSSDYAKFQGSGIARNEHLYSMARNFSLTKITNRSNQTDDFDELNFYELKFVSSDLDEARMIAERILSNVSANTNSAILQYLNNSANATKQKSLNDISHLENEMASRRKILLIGHEQKVNFLTEQAAIARALDIKENMQNAGVLAMSDKASMAVFAEAPYYLRGYEAINEELQQLQSKDETNIYFADQAYVELLEKLEIEKSNNIHKEFEAALETLPLTKSDKLFRYNLPQIEFEIVTKRSLILALSIIAGIILGVMFVLFRHGYKQHNLKNAL